jgi:polysaccharide pyruvyl transferase WcaK-like protein
MNTFLRMGRAESTTDGRDCGELSSTASLPGREAGEELPEPRPRIALLTPYTGGNLGDAAIQDAMIANLRLRLPQAQFSGVSLNCNNFLERHGMAAFPLCGSDIPFYKMCADWRKDAGRPATRPIQKGLVAARIKRAINQIPVLGRYLKAIRACWEEFRHWVQGFRFLRTQDLLIVSGGGQLNEEWGGPWGQPFALFKWALLARIAKVPYVIASVGAGKAASATSRLFLSAALRMARYRSYRDKNSRAFAAGLLRLASKDPIVPDLAFSLPSSEVPSHGRIRTIAHGRPIVAISPIIFAKPRFWPYQDQSLYDRYVAQMARLISQLLDRDYFLVIVCSSLVDDESIIPELLGRLDPESEKRRAEQMCIPAITSWQDFVVSLRDADALVVSRLHSAILGFVADKPTVAISFDPKVDWLMEDLGQTDFLLHIRDFSVEGVIEALELIQLRRGVVMEQIGAYRRRIRSTLALQYDAVAELAMASHRRSD